MKNHNFPRSHVATLRVSYTQGNNELSVQAYVPDMNEASACPGKTQLMHDLASNTNKGLTIVPKK